MRQGHVILAFSLATVALTGCTPSDAGSAPQNSAAPAQESTLPDVSIDGFGDVKAELDTVNGIATTPMTEFSQGTDSNYGRIATHASEVLIASCLASVGIDHPVAAQSDWDNLTPMEDRRFGQWDVDDAEKFGGEMDLTRGIPSGNLAAEPSPAYSDELKRCGEEVRQRPEFQMLGNDAVGQSIADRIAESAASRAEESSAGKDATKKYTQCLAEHDVKLDAETGELSGADSAVTAARCNVESGRVQTLYDVKARYETAYAKKYEKELTDLKMRMEEKKVALQAIIAGGE